MSAGLPDRGRPGMRRNDLAFMPAIVEVLESPPSPYAAALIWGLTALVATAVALMYLGRIDVVAAGRGSVLPPGNVALVQAEVDGRVLRQLARDGDHIEAGSTILELDRRTTEAELAAVSGAIQIARARLARQQALLDWLDRWPASGDDATDATLTTLTTLPEGEAQIAILHRRIRLLRSQLDLEPVPQRRLVLLADERRAASEQVDEISERIAALAQEQAKAQAQLSRTRISACVSGVLVQVEPCAPGTVVGAGRSLFQIVPDGSSLVFEARIPTPEVGHVRAGDACVIKLDAFPYTRWGRVTGTLEYVGATAVSDQEGRPFFVVRCPVDALPEAMRQAGIQLSSGMSGSLEIATDLRSILEYLLSPVVESLGRSFRER